MRNTTIWQDFRIYVLHSGNNLNKLMAVNIAVFILFGTFHVVMLIFGVSMAPYDRIESLLCVPSAPLNALSQPWSFFSYQFMHANFLHIFFNMLMFAFAGRIFREYLGDKKLLSLYLLGGVAGAIFFIAGYNLFPFLKNANGQLLGASASIMAVLVAIGTLLPRYTVFIFIIGPVRLMYIVLVLVFLDFLSIPSLNSGGALAHLGGSLFGYLYIIFLNRGTDLGAWLNKILDWFMKLSKSGTLKVHSNPDRPRRSVKSNRPGRISQEEVDTILDKIARSGYESLSQKEKEILFRASKED